MRMSYQHSVILDSNGITDIIDIQNNSSALTSYCRKYFQMFWAGHQTNFAYQLLLFQRLIVTIYQGSQVAMTIKTSIQWLHPMLSTNAIHTITLTGWIRFQMLKTLNIMSVMSYQKLYLDSSLVIYWIFVQNNIQSMHALVAGLERTRSIFWMPEYAMWRMFAKAFFQKFVYVDSPIAVSGILCGTMKTERSLHAVIIAEKYNYNHYKLHKAHRKHIVVTCQW